jgi:hypothetical protein
MKRAPVSLIALAALAAGGCPKPDQFETDVPVNVKEGGGLRVHVRLPGRYFRTGETIRVSLTATNTTGKPVQIHSPTGAPVLVRITRRSLMGLEQVRVYPTSATSNILSWTLPAGESRPFDLIVPVEPDWPVNEILFISAELNGYSQIAPAVYVMVRPPKE